MRLQLIAAMLAVAPTPLVHAQVLESGDGDASARVLMYADDDETTVVTSLVAAEAGLGAGVSLGAHALVDAISTASVDVVSAATTRWSEERVEVGGRAGAQLGNQLVALALTRSQENDWRSTSLSLSASRDMFQRNTTVTAGYAFTDNDVGRAMDPLFEESVAAHTAQLGLSQLLDRSTRVSADYSLQIIDGFLASPYRFVVADSGFRGPERHPGSRVRQALGGELVRALLPALAGTVSYRIYADDWGVWSHTARLRLAFEAGEHVLAGLEGRFHRQNRADFYRGRYTAAQRYMSSDRELATFWDSGATVDVAASLGPVRADLRATWLHYEFQDFPRLTSRNALLLGGGASLQW